MIYTLSLNPAIDYVVFMDSLNIGEISKSKKENIVVGGKGVNVSSMLKELGVQSTALGFVAGFTGEKIEKTLQSKGILTDFVHLKDGISRINVKIRHGAETDINADGPKITDSDLELLFAKFNQLKSDDIIVLAGSVPNGIDSNIYAKIAQIVAPKGVKIVVDAQKDLLVNTLQYKPFLIKPNAEELGDIFGVSINNYDDAVRYGTMLKQKGAQNVLVSLGEYGSVLVDSNCNTHKIQSFSGAQVNSVGAGDSMVAGFLAGYLMQNDYAYALKLGSAAGAATAFSEGIGTKEQIDTLLCL